MLKFLLPVLLTIVGSSSFSQSPVSGPADTSFSIFWERDLKTRIQILDPNEYDPSKKNAVLTVYQENSTAARILFKDTLYVSLLKIKVSDHNGDGIPDLLIYHTSEDPQNKTWHLYLVGQQPASLKRVKGFERVFNPFYEHPNCKLYGMESYDRRIITREYYINKEGILGLVRP